MKQRTTETVWDGDVTWRTIAASPIVFIAIPIVMVGNSLMMIASAVAGKNSSYSWETDVEGDTK